MKKQKKHPLQAPKATAITYWDAIIDLAHIDSKGYAKAVQQLENGEYQSVDFDLKNRKGALPLYGMRLNNADRVLCTTIKIDEKAYLLLLELVLNHDYQKARFMADGVLEEFIARNHDAFADYIKKQARLIESSQQKNTKFSYRSLTLHQNKIIQLSDEQNAILSSQNKALLITGGPGSGKSVLALSVLDKALEQDNGSPTEETLLYVSQSHTLVGKMERIWNEQSHSNPFNKKVVFRTYDNLLKEHSHLNDNNIVSKNHVTTWIKSYLKKAINKQNPTLNELLTSPDNDESKIIELFYQEFRIISGYDLKEYFPADTTHSAVSSLFPDVAHRKWLSSAYSAYLNCLSGEGKAHPAFFAISKDIKYSFIAVDESQDFSLGQLRTLHLWSTENRIVFFDDSHQILNDNKSKTQYILDLLNKGPCAQILLNGSYRCPREVVSFANAIMELKLILTGGLTDKHQQAQLKLNKEQEEQHPTQSNAVQWFECIEDISNKTLLFEKIKDSAQVAIVTLDCYKEEAKKRFNTVSVFTPEEIKGLEFSFVIAYQLLDEEFFHTANAEPVMAELEQHKVPKNRPKADKENNQFGPSFNRLYTAVTRCTGTLIFIQKSSHQINRIAEYLKSKINSSQTITSTVQVDDLTKDSPQTWLKRAAEALEHNNQEYAENIFITHLNKSREDFIKWSQGVTDQLNCKERESRQSKQKSVSQPIKKSIEKAINKNNEVALKKIIINALDTNNPLIIHYLLKSERSQLQFFILFNDRNFLKQTTLHSHFINALCAPNTIHDDIAGKTSILNWLSASQEGIELMFHFCTQDGFISTLDTTDQFISTLLAPKIAHCESTLYNLTSNKRAMEFLIQLSTHASLLKKLSIHDGLMPALLSAPNISQNINVTALYWLLANIKGRELFARLCSNPSFTEKLYVSKEFIVTLCALITPSATSNENTSALYWLLADGKGHDVFVNLCSNAKFVENLCASNEFLITLLALRNLQSGPHVGTSVLYRLLVASKGRKLFTLLCIDSYFLEKLSACDNFLTTVFARQNHLAGSLEDTSILYWFSDDTNGPEIITRLCSKPDLMEKMINHEDFLDAFLARRNHLSGPYEHTSALYWLLVTAKGRALFAHLCTNALFIKKLCSNDNFYTSLLVQTTQLAGPTANTSCLYSLYSDPNCIKLFAPLFNNPLFIEKLCANELFYKTLFVQLMPQTGPLEKSSSLYWLLSSEKGADYFASLSTNPHFFSQLCTNEDFFNSLFVRINKQIVHLENTSVFYFLLGGKSTSMVFTQLCAKPSFINRLYNSNEFIDALCAKRNDQSKWATNTSAFYFLTIDPQCLQIFLQLCNNKTFVAKLIANENFNTTLHAKLATIHSKQQDKSLFLSLKNTKDGRDLLQKLEIDIEMCDKKEERELNNNRYRLFPPQLNQTDKETTKTTSLNII